VKGEKKKSEKKDRPKVHRRKKAGKKARGDPGLPARNGQKGSQERGRCAGTPEKKIEVGKEKKEGRVK